MLKYEVKQGINGRAIIVQADDLMRWALHDINDVPLKFVRLGKRRALAIVDTPIKVYHKPCSMAFHIEYMKNNARMLWAERVPTDTILIRNMYEYEGTI